MLQRLALVTAFGMAAVLTAASCSSSTSGRPSPAPSVAPSVAPTSADSSQPSASPSSAAITRPSPTATGIVHRPITRPAAARILTVQECSRPADPVGLFEGLMDQFLGATPNRLPASALAQLAALRPDQRKDLVSYRAVWVQAGYPANFPAVADLDRMIKAVDHIGAIGTARDLAALPGAYVELASAFEQYVADTPATVCQKGN